MDLEDIVELHQNSITVEDWKATSDINIKSHV